MQMIFHRWSETIVGHHQDFPKLILPLR